MAQPIPGLADEPVVFRAQPLADDQRLPARGLSSPRRWWRGRKAKASVTAPKRVQSSFANTSTLLCKPECWGRFPQSNVWRFDGRTRTDKSGKNSIACLRDSYDLPRCADLPRHLYQRTAWRRPRTPLVRATAHPADSCRRRVDRDAAALGCHGTTCRQWDRVQHTQSNAEGRSVGATWSGPQSMHMCSTPPPSRPCLPSHGAEVSLDSNAA